MHSTATVYVNVATVRSDVDRALGAAPIAVLTERAWRLLTVACGSPDKAMAWATKLTARRQRVLGVFDGAMTIFVSPPDWTQEKLLGYVAVHHELLEEALGPIESIGPADSPRS